MAGGSAQTRKYVFGHGPHQLRRTLEFDVSEPEFIGRISLWNYQSAFHLRTPVVDLASIAALQQGNRHSASLGNKQVPFPAPISVTFLLLTLAGHAEEASSPPAEALVTPEEYDLGSLTSQQTAKPSVGSRGTWCAKKETTKGKTAVRDIGYFSRTDSTIAKGPGSKT